MPLGRFHTAVQINGGNQRLKGIFQRGGALPALGVDLTLAHTQVAAQVDLGGKPGQALGTHQRRAQLGQLTLRHIREPGVQQLCRHNGQHRVPQELHTLVATHAAVALVGVAGMGQCLLQQAAILKAEAQKERMIKEAEGQAQAVLKVQQATAEGLRMIKDAGADESVLTLKSLEALTKVADGKATKIIIPSEIQGIAGLATSLKEIMTDKPAEQK